MELSLSFEIKKYLVNNWNSHLVILVTVGDCEKWPYSDFFQSVFSCRKTEYGRVLPSVSVCGNVNKYINILSFLMMAGLDNNRL